MTPKPDEILDRNPILCLFMLMIILCQVGLGVAAFNISRHLGDISVALGWRK